MERTFCTLTFPDDSIFLPSCDHDALDFDSSVCIHIEKSKSMNQSIELHSVLQDIGIQQTFFPPDWGMLRRYRRVLMFL